MKDVLALNDGYVSKNIGFTISGNCNHKLINKYNYKYPHNNFSTFKNGIAITSSYSDSVYHSIIEALTKFMPFYHNNSILKNNKIILPTPRYPSNPAFHILKVILNSGENIRFTPAIVKNLIIPLPGTCGYGIKSNVLKMNCLLIEKLSKSTRAIERKVLLIKRSGNRKFKNFEETKKIITTFFSNYTINIYDDKEKIQYKHVLKMFYESSIVVGVHGAGFSNIIACRENTTIIEITTQEINKCFESLSKQLDFAFNRYIFNKSITNTYFVDEVYINTTDFYYFLKNTSQIRLG